MRIHRISGFGQEGDGRLRAGPFNPDKEDQIVGLMTELGLALGRDDRGGLISLTVEGLMLSASGRGVHGYFLGPDENEADEDLVDELVLRLGRPGFPFRISGHHWVAADRMVLNETTIFMDDGRAHRSANRFLVNREGQRKCLQSSRPISLAG